MGLLAQFFKDDWQFYRYRIVKRINALCYFLRKIPLLKAAIPASIFAAYGFKQGLAIVLMVAGLIFSFIKKFFFIIMACGIHWLLTGASLDNFFEKDFLRTLQESLWLWLLLIPVGMGFYNQYTALLSQGLINFYSEFLIPRNRFILGQRFVEVIKNAIFYLLPGIVTGRLIGQPLWTPLFLIFAYLASNFIFMYLSNLLLLRGFGKGIRWGIGIGFAGLVAAVLIVGYRFAFISQAVQLLLSPVGIGFLVLLSGIFCYLVWHYPRLEEFISTLISISDSFYTGATWTKRQDNQYIGQGLKMQQQLQVNQDDKLQQLQGSEYLNALLFSRYRSILNRRLRYVVLGIAVTAGATALLGIFGVTSALTEDTVVIILPGLFFLMYFVSFGKTIVQMLFVNCDASMLYYPFYREAKTILSGFTYRLKQTFLYNSLIVAGLLLVFLVLQLTSGFFLSWQFFLVLLLLLISLAFLFSFHELFVYYLLQPFTSDMTVQNPLYKVVSGVFYGIAYLNMQVRFSSFLYVIIISVVSLLYVGIGLAVIYKVAPKTFKIRE